MTQILIINTSKTPNSLLLETLKSFGAQVHASSMELDDARSIPPDGLDLIILDSNEIKRAIETCKNIRQLSSAPLVVLSNTSQPKMIASVLDSGADDYLVKPVSKELLHARINTFVRRKSD